MTACPSCGALPIPRVQAAGSIVSAVAGARVRFRAVKGGGRVTFAAASPPDEARVALLERALAREGFRLRRLTWTVPQAGVFRVAVDVEEGASGPDATSS